MQIGVTIPYMDMKKLESLANEKRLSISSMARLLIIERLDQIEVK